MQLFSFQKYPVQYQELSVIDNGKRWEEGMSVLQNNVGTYSLIIWWHVKNPI